MTRRKNDHALNLFISYEQKKVLQEMADRCDRTISDVVRTLLKIGLPILQALSEAEEVLYRQQADLFCQLRQGRQRQNSGQAAAGRGTGGEQVV
ncbi:MAG: hypothetical protein KAT58_08600 [candidate division Zixibacteria bacterium]|nr:hypothetical protein [candidate division Zixibacteria bacterium]